MEDSERKMSRESKVKLFFVIRVFIFFGVFLCLFKMVNKVFLYKDDSFYNYSRYMELQEGELDILIMGNSHSMDAIDSSEFSVALEADYGINVSVFNMSLDGMNVEQIAYRFEEALKTQNPKLLVIETYSIAAIGIDNGEKDIGRSVLDYMPLSEEKTRFIEENIEEEKASFYIPFIKYHSRWNELTKLDFSVLFEQRIEQEKSLDETEKQEASEYIGEHDGYFEQDFHLISDIQEIDEKKRREVEFILKLAEENGMKVLFLSVPYKNEIDFVSTELIKYNNYLEEKYVDNKQIFMLDMNADMSNLQWNYEYMKDEGHVNDKGRDIVMHVLANYVHAEFRSYLEN